jgi:IS30 family transposase
MTMIADRPVEVGDRVQVGHWEGDCIMGVGNRSAIGTLVERTTRFVILIHVPTGRPTAAAMRDGITDALDALAPHPLTVIPQGAGVFSGGPPPAKLAIPGSRPPTP